MKDWKYIDEYDSLPNKDLIICDTDNFTINCSSVDAEILHKIIKNIRRTEKVNNECKFRRDEILGTLGGGD